MLTKKHIITLLLLMLFGLPAAMAQSGVVVTGSNATGADGNVTSTIGQVDYLMAVNIDGSIAQGLQHPFAIPSSTGSINGTTRLCVGGTTTLTDTTAGGLWFSSNATVATVGSLTGIVSALAGGRTTIVYFVPGSGSLASASFIVDSALPAIGAISGTMSVCPGSTGTLLNTISGGAWSIGGGGIASIDTFTGILSGIATGTAVVTYTTTNACGTSDTDGIIAVTTSPLAGSLSGASSLCESATISLSASVSGGAWSSSATGICTVGSTGIVSGVASGTASVSYAITNGCGTAYATHTVTVIPLVPDAGIVTGLNVVTVGSAITLINAVSGGVWSGTTVHATVASGGVVTGLSVGQVVVSYTVTNACGSATATKTVAVNGPIAPITGATSLCIGATAALSSSPGGAWFSSNFAVASVGSTGIVTGRSAGTATITYIILSSFVTTTIAVYPSPAPISGAGSMCIGNNITLTDTTTGGTWRSGNTAIATADSATGVVTGVNAGTAIITYSAGCSVIATVTVNTTPVAISGNNSVCEGFTTTLGNTTTGGAWTSNNTAVATIGSNGGVVTGVAAGTTSITYALANGCLAQKTITVTSVPAISGSTGICTGTTSLLTASTTGGTWTSSTTGVATIGSTSGTVAGISAGTASITFTIAGGCRAVTTVTVNTMPTVTGGSPVCPGNTATLSATPSGGAWTSGNTAVATVTAGIVTGVTGGTAIISYMLPAGCLAVKTATVIVAPPNTGVASLCMASSSTLTNAVSGGTWQSSATGIATVGLTSGIATGVTAGTANITYSFSSSSCKSITTLTVSNVTSVSGVASVCIGASSLFTNSSPGGTWSSSNSAKATVDTVSGMVTGMAAGTAVITYNLAATCKATKTVSVAALPSITSTLNAVCQARTINLTCTPTGGVWSSSTPTIGSISNLGVVSGIAAGTTIITYALATGCNDTQMVTVNPVAPIAGTATVCMGQSVTLTNAVTGGTWLSANTTKATIDTFTGVVNASSVNYGTVVITYKTSGSCTSTITLTVSVLSAISGPGTVCQGKTIAYTYGGTGTGMWSSSNTAIANVGSTTGIVSGVVAGSATITYSLGTSCTATKAVTVNPSAPISGASGLCIGQSTTLTNPISGGTWRSSNTGVATIGSTSGVVSGVANGTAIITYALSTCQVTSIITIGSPTPITGSSNVCQGQTSNFTSAPFGGIWSSSATAVATVSSALGVVTGVSAGTAQITYSFGSGCLLTKVVTVNPMSSISGATSVCRGQSVTLTNAISGGIWFSANSLIAAIGSVSGVVNGASSGTVPISYTINGCTSTLNLTVLVRGDITGTLAVCEGDVTNLTQPVSGGIWSSSNNAIATVGSITGQVSGISAGTASISVILTTGCITAATVTVNPIASIIGYSGSICIGASDTLANTTSGGLWTSSNPTIAYIGSTTGIVTALRGGAPTVSYTITATGCRDVASISVLACRSANEENGLATDHGTYYILSPNPNIGEFTLKGQTDATQNEAAGIDVVDMLGQIVYRKETITSNGLLNEQITLPGNLANGMYLLNLRIAGNTRVFHFVVRK